MIFEVQSYALIASDILYSLSVGFLVGFIYQILSIFFYKGKTALFIKDILTALIFSVTVYSFAISFSNYHILRWYNIVPAIIGFLSFVPCFSGVGHILISMLDATVSFYVKRCIGSILHKTKKYFAKKSNKEQKITHKNADKLLKKEALVLYN